MAAQGVHVTPKILKWAREKSGLKIAAITDKAKVSKEDLLGWENDQGRPTISQLRRLCKIYRRPPAFFFLDDVPNHFAPPIVDYRSASEVSLEPTGNLLNILQFFRGRQRWLEEFGTDLGLVENDFVGSMRGEEDATILSLRARTILELDSRPVAMNSNASARLASWLERYEEIGVFVGQFGQFPQFKIKPMEISGVCLVSKVAPMVLLNMSEGPARRTFTLMHEFIHLLRGAEGISTPLLDSNLTPSASSEEALCEYAAGMALVPPDLARKVFNQSLSPAHAAAEIARLTGVSGLAALVRLAQERMFGIDSFALYINEVRGTPPEGGGGTYWPTWRRRLGARFAEQVVHAFNERIITTSEASRLLDVKANRLSKAAQQVLE